MTTTKPPLVSIVMPTYNSKEFVKHSISSIINQNFEDWELIIVDDASKDKTGIFIEESYGKNPQIKLINLLNNSGAAVARNTGIAASKGRHIAFLDSDDLWDKFKLNKQLSFMAKYNAALSFTAYGTIKEDGTDLNLTKHAPGNVSYNDMLKKNFIGCSTAMYDRDKIGTIFMPEIRKRQDYGLWLKILRKTSTAHYLDEILTLYRYRDNSISSNKLSLIKYHFELFHVHEGMSKMQSSWWTVNNIYNRLKEK